MVSYTGQFFASAVDHPGDSQWHTLGMVTNINNSGFNVHVGWDSGATGGEAPPAGTVTFYIDSVMVTQGEVGENQPAAIPYMQEDPALEMTRCERHYEVASAIDTRWHFPAVKSPANVTYSYWRYHFRTFKSAAPTITITENTVFLHQNPTDGNTNSGDVASTATQTAAEVNEQGWRLNISYGTNQSTYNVIELQGNWEAEV